MCASPYKQEARRGRERKRNRGARGRERTRVREKLKTPKNIKRENRERVPERRCREIWKRVRCIIIQVAVPAHQVSQPAAHLLFVCRSQNAIQSWERFDSARSWNLKKRTSHFIFSFHCLDGQCLLFWPQVG